MEPFACEHHARLDQLLVELAHPSEELLAREDSRFRLLVCLDDHHEPHRSSLLSTITTNEGRGDRHSASDFFGLVWIRPLTMRRQRCSIGAITGRVRKSLSVIGSRESEDIRRAIDAVWRIESARLIAGLARIVRDVGLAEDLAQDALVAALERWPESGVPENPGAWLMATAKHRAIDLLRRKALVERKHEELGREIE